MVPIVSLIGRRSVGKSSLFNCLTNTSDALVGLDLSGVTRDRRYGVLKWKQYQLIIIDTGGIEKSQHQMETSIFYQSECAILESDLILFVVDGKVGVVSSDYEIVDYLYKFQKCVFVVVNKIDNFNLKYLQSDFYSLGFKKVIFVSSIHGFGIDCLLREIFLKLRSKFFLLESKVFVKNSFSEELKIFLNDPKIFFNDQRSDIIVLAVIGMPNVGKSSFINCILGENRVVVCDMPGTTRDNICVSTIYGDHKYILIDTAGIRKKNKIFSFIEKFSISKTLQIVKNVTVVLLLINAENGVSNSDLSLLNSIIRIGKSLVIGINKWDLLSSDDQKKFKVVYNKRMNFIRFINTHFISSLYGEGISDLLKSVVDAHYSSFKSYNSSYITRIMYAATERCRPPRVFGKDVKLKYAHIGGHFPLLVVIHGNNVFGLPNNYVRYLINYFSYALKISGFSVCIRFQENK